MKWTTLLCIFLLFISACEKGTSDQSDVDLDLSKMQKLFYKLSIVSLGAVSPTYSEREIIVDNKKELRLHVAHYEDFETKVKECSGHAELADSDFEDLLSAISKSNLSTYSPPMVSDDDCNILVGGRGYIISYMQKDKTYNEFHTFCEMDQKVYDLIDTAMNLASDYVSSCSDDVIIDDGDSDEDFCGSSTYASCAGDSDCKPGGCGGELCEGVNESNITPCIYRYCADPNKYNVTCQCFENQCQWQ